MTQKPLKSYDFTLSYKYCQSHNEILDFLCQEITVQKYVFQLERGDNDYIHWQGRFTLWKPRYLRDIINLFSTSTSLKYSHLSPSSSNSVNKNYYGYCSKKDTRVTGTKTYKDTDHQVINYNSNRLVNVTKEKLDRRPDIPQHASFSLLAENCVVTSKTPRKPKPKQASLKRATIKKLMKDAVIIETIAENVGLKISTMDKYIIEILRDEDMDIDLDYFGITEDIEMNILEAIKKVGTEKLRPIKDLIEEHITWLQIKVYLLVFEIETM